MEELVDASMKFTRVLKRKGVSQATLQVAVRARPLSRKEMSNGARTITKLVDERCVVVLDPDEDANVSTVPGVPKPLKRKEVAAGVRKKERRYVFDAAYDGEASNEQVYRGTVLPHIAGGAGGGHEGRGSARWRGGDRDEISGFPRGTAVGAGFDGRAGGVRAHLSVAVSRVVGRVTHGDADSERRRVRCACGRPG